ncbi:fungal-specific transcription factor domain-containing protein [Whalleya microplaca]|nr:fungal-specific transcription factor domain-containing protein [Whalleya microplaca]
MFYTFTSTPTSGGQRNPKRLKVSRACNYCRKYRVRCDAESPCSRCVANNIECVVEPPSRPDSESSRYPPNEPLSTRTTVVPSAASTIAASPVSSKPEEMDSTVGFMTKISTFCSAISQLSSDSLDDSPPPYSLSDRLPEAGKGSPIVLSKSQVTHILDVYWTRCHPFAPVLSRPEVDAVCQNLWAPDGSELQNAPLIDGIIALCLRHLHGLGLNRRLLGLYWEQDPSLAFFQRCLAASSQYIAFAEPSLDLVQCYVLMTLYLLDAGQHQPAYSIAGLALRFAHVLKLHQGLPDTDPNFLLACRIWWTVVHLDFRCSRLLGRPVGVQLAEITCSLPDTDGFTYHARAAILTKTTLTVMENLSRHLTNPHEDRIVQVESRASALSAEVYRLWEWRDRHLRPAIRRPLHVDSKGSHDWIVAAADASPLQLLQDVLLELQYYDEIIGLHRPFVCFPNKSLIPQRSPQADAHATTALHHAMATVDLAHRIMSTTDVLFGRSEVYQWQWNALLTMVGFLMAHPLCPYAPLARHHAQLALEIFSAADSRNTAAVRAAALTRSLCAKVDSLVQMVKSVGHQPTAETQASSAWDISNTSTDLSHSTSDALWSWTDMINPDMWTAYSNEINDVFADFPDLPFANDDFPQG